VQKYEEYFENDFLNARFNILIKCFKKTVWRFNHPRMAEKTNCKQGTAVLGAWLVVSQKKRFSG
jgi:hypothetical protein